MIEKHIFFVGGRIKSDLQYGVGAGPVVATIFFTPSLKKDNSIFLGKRTKRNMFNLD